MDSNPINSRAGEEGGTTVVGCCENEATLNKSNAPAATEEKKTQKRVSDVGCCSGTAG